MEQTKYKKTVGAQLKMINNDTLYIDAKSWLSLKGKDMAVVNEYRKQNNGSFKYDSGTCIRPDYIVYARPMILYVKQNGKEVENA